MAHCSFIILSEYCSTLKLNFLFSFGDKYMDTDYWITTRSFPYRGPYWPGKIWASTSSQANMGVSFLDVHNKC
jgi:hypothetical protein